MGFILGYGAHCFELYGIRTWIVAFWTFVSMRHSDAPLLTPIVVSVVFSLLAMPASILGNEFALRFGRHRAITAVMLSSAVVALLMLVVFPWVEPHLPWNDVTVDSGANIQAAIEGANVNVRGQVTGNVSARKRLTLGGSGRLNGDVRVSRLTVEDGATLNGNVTMQSEKS